MGTIYNISLQVENIKDKLVSPVGAQKIVKIFEDAGLTGEKHVDNIGRVYDGYDSLCEDYLTGKYGIFVRNRPEFRGKSLREIHNFLKLVNSKYHNHVIEMGEDERLNNSLDSLEAYDPLARDMAYDMYMQIPLAHSLSINTPVGVQDTHIHLPNGNAIQFWRPTNTKELYDLDTLRGFLFDIQMDCGEFNKLGMWRQSIAYKLYHKLMAQPDNFNKGNFIALMALNSIQKYLLKET